MTLGEKIQALRKQHGLSQEALAEQLSVTRQTVSKWELNRSIPDLDFIAQLSELFHVSADYLIKDEMTTPDTPPAPKKTFHLTEKAKRSLLAALSVSELAAACICLVCDYFTSEHLSWSLIAIVSMAAAWFVLLPVLTAKENVIFKTLLNVSLVPTPLLAVLAPLLKKAVIFTLGACISLVCILTIWIIYRIILRFRAQLWRALGFALLVILPLPIAILYMTAAFIPQVQIDFTSTVFNSGITVILSLACFGIDHLRRQKQGDDA